MPKLNDSSFGLILFPNYTLQAIKSIRERPVATFRKYLKVPKGPVQPPINVLV